MLKFDLKLIIKWFYLVQQALRDCLLNMLSWSFLEYNMNTEINSSNKV